MEWVNTEGLSQLTTLTVTLTEVPIGGVTSIELPESVTSSNSKADTISHNLPRLTQSLTPMQLEYSREVLKDFTSRLMGNGHTSAELTDHLIHTATAVENLSQMYEGWMPWI